MSDLFDLRYNEDAAVAFNEKQGSRLGWYRHLPPEAIAAYPDLGLDPVNGSNEEKQRFAKAVKVWQTVWYGDPLDRDGKLGRSTWAKMKKIFVKRPERRVIHNENDIELTPRSSSQIITWRDEGGFDLHPYGRFRAPEVPGTRKIMRIVLHWGGTSPRRCFKTLTGKRISSHFGIEADKIYQWCDLDLKTFHAGAANSGSIGIDICQQPTLASLSHIHGKGFTDVHKIANPSKPRRGDREVLTLHEATAQSVRDLLEDLCQAFHIPLRVPRTEEGGYDYTCWPKERWKAFSGVMGHFSSSAGKWDPVAYWPQIFDPLQPE